MMIIIFVSFPLVLYLLLNRIIKPVSQIVKGIEGLSGNLSGRINVKTGDEFELIANTFNKMAKELEGLYRGMEKKVEEKTKEVQEKMEEIEQRNVKDEALLSSIGEGMMAMDEKGKVIMINKKAEEILGCKKDEIFGKSCFEIRMENEKGEEISKEERPANIVLKTGKQVFSSSIFVFRQSGEKIPIMMTASPVVYKNKIAGVISIFRDITKEKEIDKAKTEFVSLASHQLRTPLGSISWNAEMLMEEGGERFTQKEMKYLKKIYGSSVRMTELVSALLNVSRIDLGTFSIDVKMVDLKGIVKSVVSDLGKQIQDKELEISQNYDEKLPQFQADPKLMQIIFQNFISNSVKYTPAKGKINIQVGFATDKLKKKYLEIKISDNGYGIPQKQQDKIFTKLFRADNIKEVETDGTGLGLYIVKSIVDNAGGTIEFHSEENKGTEFIVRFPEGGMKSKEGIKKLS